MKPFRQGITQFSVTGNRIKASACVPADSTWYIGHFPGNPILPGIAILALVEEAICAAESEQKNLVVMTGIGRVRFRLPVKPDDLMVLDIVRQQRKEGYAYEFTVFLGDEPACTGVMKGEPAAG
jgi:3-hydroxymyristoyl/3-hydroxydecanoyl-(acyl carrier protein) dehydratase